MKDDMFTGMTETGWDHAPWEIEPTFSDEEWDILLDGSIPVDLAAERIGCVEHDVRRLRDSRNMLTAGRVSPPDIDTTDLTA